MKLTIVCTLLALPLVCVLLAGCQSVTVVEFQEITEHNKEFSTPPTAGTPGYGPLKSLNIRDGALNFSDNKNFTFDISAFKIGM